MTQEDIGRVRDDFVAAAKRAREVGFESLELHFAHGYLAQSFFSEHSYQRTDASGGSYENRRCSMRETLAAVRKVSPARFPLTIRFVVLAFAGTEEQTCPESMHMI